IHGGGRRRAFARQDARQILRNFRALDYLIGGGQSCAVNLANARGHSVKEVIVAAERVTGTNIRVESTPRRPGDPPVLIGTADHARGLLGWTPARSDLQLQISDSWEWIKNRTSKRPQQLTHARRGTVN